MSQIFDALQRSDAERSGDNSPDQLQPTDVLRRAERLEAAGRWQKETGSALAEPGEALNGASGFPSLEPDLLAAAGVSVAPSEPRSDVFAQFRSTEVSVNFQSRLVCLTEPDSPAAEAFRLLGVRLRDLRRTRPLKKLLVTSSIPQEGKSMVSANLAVTLARAKQRVLVLEGDVRRPALSEAFGLKPDSGLCDWLRGDQNLTSSIYYLEGPGLWIMPSGSTPQNPLELLQSSKLAALISQLSEWFDTIVIDSPPVLPLADTSIWMRLADGILLVARQGTTQKKQLQKGLEAIDPQKLIGALLNCSTGLLRNGYDYYYRSSNLSA